MGKFLDLKTGEDYDVIIEDAFIFKSKAGNLCLEVDVDFPSCDLLLLSSNGKWCNIGRLFFPQYKVNALLEELGIDLVDATFEDWTENDCKLLVGKELKCRSTISYYQGKEYQKLAWLG